MFSTKHYSINKTTQLWVNQYKFFMQFIDILYFNHYLLPIKGTLFYLSSQYSKSLSTVGNVDIWTSTKAFDKERGNTVLIE